jgi:predicted nucleotide-binding protein (sugar kinase/HSP70/actin superfamily)
MGIDTIPSESICYPAKLTHGHVIDLVNKGVNKIFYPAIYYNVKENESKNHVYNCPIVISYTENINLNIDKIKEKNIKFYNPYLSLEHKSKLAYRLQEVLKDENIALKEIQEGVNKAYDELYKYKLDIRNVGQKTIKELEEKNIRGIVLAGKPYHLDPEINHGIPNLINSLGFAVLTEDSISHLSQSQDDCISNQWIYHSRLYNAADVVCQNSNLDMIQLTSFGCTTDAISTDIVENMLKSKNKIHSLIKIDQINNLGSAKIRIRSLVSSIKERQERNTNSNIIDYKPINKNEYKINNNVNIKDSYTLLIPQISDIHLTFMESAFENSGYKAEVLKNNDEDAIKEGLKYVNNDLCYPFIIIVGQIMKAIKSNKYDLNKIAILMIKTDGPCIASNMTNTIKDIFNEQGLGNIPVIPLAAPKDKYSPKLKLSPNLLYKIGQSIVYGDLLTKVLLKTRPYEKEKNSANILYENWVEKCKKSLKSNNIGEYKKNIYSIVNDFEKLPIYEDLIKPKVGLTGDIYIKFNDFSNNNIISLLEKEGAEVIAPDLMSFLLYCGYGGKLEHENISPSLIGLSTSNISVGVLEFLRKDMQKSLRKSKRFSMAPMGYELTKCAENYISLGNQVGDGWVVTGEIVDYVKNDITNILSMQPFGCLPGHVVSKGIIKRLKEDYPYINISSIDYDPSEAKVNQLNRIRLMMSIAHKNLG